jgi:hypothetical protein
MYTREQLADRFNPHPDTNPDILPRLTEAQLDTLEAIQAAGMAHGRAGYYPDGDFSSDADWCNGTGRIINRLETELEIDDGAVFDLYSDAHSEHFTDGTINPGDRDWMPTIFDFHFGANGETACSVHARSVEKALELAADWLAEHAPGHLIEHDSDKAREIWIEACRELGLDPESTEAREDSDGRINDKASEDLTYTEAGYIRSHEWYVNERT